MNDIYLKDLKEFLGWAVKQGSKSPRFKLNDRYGTIDGRRQYQLDVAGSGDKFRPMQSIHIPREIGEPLAEVWRKNAYGTYIGLRNIKAILKIVKVSDAVIAEYEATRSAIEAQQERRRNYNRADYALSRLEVAERELGDVMSTLKELGLDEGLDFEIETRNHLNDVRYTLEGFKEALGVTG